MNTLFVSSTFRDMQEERDLLQNKVAPSLNERAQRYGQSIAFCDLRWGVNTLDLDTEEGSRKVLDVCLDTIDRCQPPMVVILGYRYGWIPEENLIRAASARKELKLDDLEKSVTALEIEYGAFRRNPDKTLFYFREIEQSYPADYGSEDEVRKEKLKRLKERIERLTNGKVKTYTVRWTGEGFEGLDEFAAMVEEDVAATLQPEWERMSKLSPFDRERLVQESFVEEKTGLFRARGELVRELIEQLNKGKTKLAIQGKSGMGKSTLFCKLAQELKGEGYEVLPFISGLTQESNDAFDILRNSVFYLEEKLGMPHYGEEKEETGEKKSRTIKEWRERLAELCALYSKRGKKFVLMVDAVDQLYDDENREKQIFVPYVLSGHIRCVMTSTERIAGQDDTVILQPLTEEEKRKVIQGTLAGSYRELDKEVEKEILQSESSDNPLFISLLVQRLCLLEESDFSVMKDSASISEHQRKIIRSCPDDLEEMSAELFQTAGKQINEKLIARVGEYLATSRHGLRPSDLACLTGEEWSELDFIRFFYYLREVFLIRPDGRYDFSHKSVRAGFAKSCGQLPEEELKEYFKALPSGDEVRMRELVYHLIRTDDKRGFVDYITKEYSDEEKMNFAAKDAYEACLSDGGKWLCALLAWAGEYTKSIELNEFVNYYLYKKFIPSVKELQIKRSVSESNLIFAQKLENKLDDWLWKRELFVSYGQVAEIYQAFGGREILEKALALYQKGLELSEELVKQLGTAKAKRDLAVGYGKIAGIYQAFGGKENLERALEFYQKGLDLREDLVKQIGMAKVKRDLAVGYGKIAGIYQAFGGKENLERALGLYQKALQLSEELVKQLGTAQSKSDLSISYNNVAGIYEQFGGRENLERALGLYQKGLELREELVKQLGTAEAKRDLWVSYEKVAGIYAGFGGRENLKRALELNQKALQLSEGLAKQLGTADAKRDLSISYEEVAGIYEKFGGRENLERALGLYQKGLELREELVKQLDTAESKRDLSISYNKVAGIYAGFGGQENLERAFALYQKGLELSEGLAKQLGTAKAKRDLWISYNNIAGIYEVFGGQGNLERALALYQKGLELSEELFDKLGTAESKRDFMVSCFSVARIYQAFGGKEKLEKALKLYQKGLKLNEELAKEQRTFSAYEDLVISLIQFGTHPLLSDEQKRGYFKAAERTCSFLYRNTRLEKYAEWLEIIRTELSKLS